MNKKSLVVENLTFAYTSDTNTVVRSVSFKADSGDLLFVLGPNGVGKTTLFKLLTGILTPNDGGVFFNGLDLNHLPQAERAKKFAYVPQSHTPPFPFKVFDVVLMGRTAHLNRFASPTPKDRKIAHEAIKTLGIEYLKDKNYTEISGGERQLVLIARALCQGAEVLILDEPTANLDFGNQAKVFNHLRSLSKLGYIIILSSHVPNDAFQYATQVMLMQEGEIGQMDIPDRIITQSAIQKLYKVDANIIEINSQAYPFKICIPKIHEMEA